MATTTYLTFWALIAGIGIGTTAFVAWVKWEIKRVNMRISDYDTFVSETVATIANMSTDIAVTREAVENIKANIKDTKTSIAEINRTLRSKLTGK